MKLFIMLMYKFLMIFGLFPVLNALKEMKSIEKDLIRTLINKYEHHGIFGRPVNNSMETIVIEHKLQLIQILDLDENRQILVTNCWSNLRWKDSLLIWDPKKYGNITTVRVYPDHIWTPDIMLYNFADERSEDRRECRVKIYANGMVLWVPQSLYKSSCSVEITYFPFDTQNCKLEFGSLAYDNTKLDIIWWVTENVSENYIDYTDYMPSNEWEIYGSSIDSTISDDEKIFSKKIFRFSQISEKESKLLYPVLRYILRLSRNPSFYITILIVPCTLLSLLTLVIFWLPPESPAKLMLGISIFVAFFVLLLLLADFTPREVKNFPLIGAYFCLNMVMITSSTFLATLIINIHFKGAKTGPIPKTVRRIILEGLGKLVLIRQHINLPVYNDGNENCIKKSSLKIQSKNSQLWIKNTDKRFRKKTINSSVIYKPRNYHSKKMIPIVEPCLNVFIQGHLEFERDIREISRYIRIIVNREKTEISRNLIAMEYRTLALILDRLFFILYISTMATSVIVCYSNTNVIDFDLTRNISNRL